jgi:2'-5' RNA ligase
VLEDDPPRADVGYFVGISLDAQQAEEVAVSVLPLLPAGATPDVSSKYHLTLIYLGAVTDAALTEVSRNVRLAAERAQPFAFTLHGLGQFRGVNIVWAGVNEPSGVLAKLRDEVFRSTMHLGTRFAETPTDDIPGFNPHVSVARVDRGVAVAFKPDQLAWTWTQPIEVCTIELFASVRGTGYTLVESFALGSR